MFLLLLLGLSRLVSGSSQAQWTPYFDWDEIDYFIAFGDSYTYVQGELGYPSYSFIGDYLPGDFAFTPSQLLSNKIIQSFNGTSAGGPNWVEFLTHCAVEPGQWLPSECPDKQVWDFAFAGADYSLEFLPLHHDFTVPMVNQTQQYLTYAEPVLRPRMGDKSKSLVAIWIGINDVNDALSAAVDEDEVAALPDLFDSIIHALFIDSVQDLYHAGFRRFLFLNLPPLDRAPSVNANATKADETARQVNTWNALLDDHSRAFAESHRDANVLLYDTNSFLNGVLDAPDEKYGFSNKTGYCPGYANETVWENPKLYGCTALSTYFWFNTGHITSRVHEIMARDLEEWLKNGPHSI